MKLLTDEVDSALRQNFKSLELLITESHEFLINDCVLQAKHSIEQPYLNDFNDLLSKSNSWRDSDQLCITSFKHSKDRQENQQRFADFNKGLRVPVKVYLIVYIVSYEIRLYVLKEHKLHIESQTPYLTLRKREDANIDEENLSTQIINFTQSPNKENILKVELASEGKMKTCIFYKLKNEKILDGLCSINYG